MDKLVRERTALAVLNILRTAGWQVHPAEYPLDLTAVKGTQTMVILCTTDPKEVERFGATNYTVQEKGVGGICTRLLVTFDVQQTAPGCIVWYAEEFMQYAGQAAYATVFGKQLILPFPPETAVESVQSDESTLPEESHGGHTGKVLLSPQFTDREGCGEDEGICLPHLPINMTRGEAEERAKIAGMVTLRFVPVWMYTYTCTGEEAVFDKVVSFDQSGTGAINALNGKETAFDPDVITRKMVSKDTKVLTPRITQDEAIEIVVSGLIESLSQTVQDRKVWGQSISYQDKHVSPRRDQIDITMSEIYVPVWLVKGNRTVEINAYSGQICRSGSDGAVFI